jgi:hypothetical protein
LMMKLIVDRCEGDLAVCEKDDKSTLAIPLSELPLEVRPGDVVVFENGLYRIDLSETKDLKKLVEKLANDLWE